LDGTVEWAEQLVEVSHKRAGHRARFNIGPVPYERQLPGQLDSSERVIAQDTRGCSWPGK